MAPAECVLFPDGPKWAITAEKPTELASAGAHNGRSKVIADTIVRLQLTRANLYVET
jgi:hypothetical protein